MPYTKAGLLVVLMEKCARLPCIPLCWEDAGNAPVPHTRKPPCIRPEQPGAVAAVTSMSCRIMVGLQVSPAVSKGCLLVASGLGVLAAAVGLDPAAAAHWTSSPAACLKRNHLSRDCCHRRG